MGWFGRLFGPPSEAKFAKIIVKALRRAGDDRESTYDKEQFRLIHTKDGESAGVTNLRNLYTEYCKVPRSMRAEMLARVCKGMLNRMEMPEDFEDVTPDLMPTVRTRSMLDILRLDAELSGSDSMGLPALPLTDHLIVCLVYDLPNSMRFVTQENLDTWKVTLEDAVEVARHNLAERPFSMIALGQKLYIAESGDAYDTTRLLLTDHIERLELSGEPIALPVTRDCLLITGSTDVDGLNIMLEIAKQKENDARPVCAIPLRLNAGEWEVWRLPQNHSLFGKFKELELRYFAGEYAEQKNLLEKRNEREGEDVFVASFSVIQRDEQLLSFGVWSKTVPTWLPKTDYVALFDPESERKLMVRWEQLVEVAGSLMQPMDYYPPRYSVVDFPGDEQWVQLQGEDWSD